jgi:hypothetical protein
VIIHDLDVIGVTGLPAKAYPPLVIDANAVLTAPIALECFQPVTRWRPQIIQTCGPMQ